MMRSLAKGVVEFMLANFGPAAISRRAFRERRLILAYHNIVPDNAPVTGDASLHLPQAEFAAQLEILQRHCDVVTLDAVLQHSPSTGGRPRVAITFDDGYSGALSAGVAELARRGLPATIFIAPDFIGGRSFWWDALSGSRSGLPDTLRKTALVDWQGSDFVVRTRAGALGHSFHDLPGYARAATLDELRTAASVPGIALGSHTWSHPNLTRLSDAELVSELARPLAWLEERFPTFSLWLSYPYGLADPRVAGATKAAGYHGALLVDGGWFSPVTFDRFRLPRLNIPAGLSLNGFTVRTAGLLQR